MVARISKQARYTSKLSLCTASDCRETSWQSQLPWEIRSRVTQGTQSTQSTQREGELTMMLSLPRKSTWTLRKVVPCVLQHIASTSISGTSDAARARAGDGEQAHCLSQRTRGSTCDKGQTTSQAPHPHMLGGRSSPCPSGVGLDCFVKLLQVQTRIHFAHPYSPIISIQLQRFIQCRVGF